MTKSPTYALVALGGLLALGACAQSGPGDDLGVTPPDQAWPEEDGPGGVVGVPIAVEPQVVIDGGSMCLYPDGRGQAIDPPGTVLVEAGDRLQATITHPDCLSSSCDVNRVASCDFRWDDDVLILRSRIAFDALSGPACTLDCLTLTASCESEPLPAGEIVVHWGARRRLLTIPAEVVACRDDECATDGDCPEICARDEEGYFTCQPWAQIGEACAGFDRPAGRRCAPGLVCTRNVAHPDEPARCLPGCETDDDCASGLCAELGGVTKACLPVE